MYFVNAISKVRFASAKPQRIRLGSTKGLVAELLCMEAGQKIVVRSGQWAYYVITGTAKFTAGNVSGEVPAGQAGICEVDEVHTVANASQQRLVCLIVGVTS